MINGIFVGFFIPPAIVIILAVYFAVKKLYQGESYGIVLFSFVKTIVFGALVCLALIMVWAVIYYAGGGH